MGDYSHALEARSLRLAWDEGDLVVDDATFHVDASEIVCLIGRSGCGKTTLLHALAGLTRPLSGDVYVHGEKVTGRAGHVSYMLQKDLLLENLTIIDNACLPLTLAGMRKKQAREQARPYFSRFGLEGTEKSWPSQLSGGMRQRAAFLRTYLMGNDVVLLDEPFSALDALTRSDMREWYRGMARELGYASLVVTHDTAEVKALADRAYALVGRPARLVECGLEEEDILAALG